MLALPPAPPLAVRAAVAGGRAAGATHPAAVAAHSLGFSASVNGHLWQLQPVRGQQQRRQLRPGSGLTVEARDGKKRRRPQAKGGSSSSDEEAQAQRAPQPLRVDPTINISARAQIERAKMKKEYERQQAAGYRKPAVAQGYRRESMDPEEYRRQREEAERWRAEQAKRKSDQINLQCMFQTNISAPGEQPTGVTLVDGYNLLWACRRVGSVGLQELVEAAAATSAKDDELEAARGRLLEELDVYSREKGMFVHVAFDAMGRGFSSQHNTLGMIVTFCGTEEADSFIIRQAQAYISQGVQKVCIVSNDIEVAQLGVHVEYQEPGRQAVCAVSCSSLIRLMEDSHRSLHDSMEEWNLRQQYRPSLSGAAGRRRGRTRAGGGSAHALKVSSLHDLRNVLVQEEEEKAREQRQAAAEARRRQQQARQSGESSGSGSDSELADPVQQQQSHGSNG